MRHNERFKAIVGYAKRNDLKPNVLYHFVIGQNAEIVSCIEDKEMVAEEFFEILDFDGMEKHISSILKREKLPFQFKSISYMTNHDDDCKLIVSCFSFQDVNSIEESCIECFFAFKVNQ